MSWLDRLNNFRFWTGVCFLLCACLAAVLRPLRGILGSAMIPVLVALAAVAWFVERRSRLRRIDALAEKGRRRCAAPEKPVDPHEALRSLMTLRFIDDYDVILLDMGNTFMFDADRFHDAAEIASTYRSQGGTLLAGDKVASIIAQMEEIALRYSRDAEYFERFPQMAEVLREVPKAAGLPGEEMERLVRVYSLQEAGTISPESVAVLRQLRRTHAIGVVSNVWAPSSFFRRVFDEVGVTDLFSVIVFSSDLGVIKPSPLIFREALAAFDAPQERIVYVGDSFKRDVAGAAAVGISSVWISNDGQIPAGFDCRPNLIVRSLADLLAV